MKIIAKDNLNRDTVSDVLVCENVEPNWAEQIITALNETHQGGHWFEAVEDDYKLYTWEP